MPIPDDLNDLLDNDDVDEIFTLEEEIAAGSFGTVYQVPAHAHAPRRRTSHTSRRPLCSMGAHPCGVLLHPRPTTHHRRRYHQSLALSLADSLARSLRVVGYPPADRQDHGHQDHHARRGRGP